MNVFIGHFHEALEEILHYVKIAVVIMEHNKSSKEMINLCETNAIPYHTVKNHDEMLDRLSSIEKIDLCFVASFGIILRNGFIQKCGHIVNFHPGDVDVCRGRHPLPVAIANRHTSMGVTAHLIDSEKIDAGPVLAKMNIPVDYDESYRANERRLLEVLRVVVRYVLDRYEENGNFISYSWVPGAFSYYKPLSREILDKIIASGCLREISR